jgi:hypothetical protein
MSKKQIWMLIGIMALAVFFRFYQINSMPGGLFPDEAANGLDINLMQEGHLQPFYERGNGREALFFYMLWGSVELFGKGPWQHHIVSALVGVIAVWACFLVTRKLFHIFASDDQQRERATTIALWATFFIAVSTWHVVLSRTAFRANLIAPVGAFTFYFLLETFSATELKKRLWWALATGAMFALGFYTYIAFRIMVPIVGALIFWPLIVDLINQPRFSGIKKYFSAALIAALGFALVIAPIAHYFYTHPGSFVGRSGQVSIFNPELNQGDLPATLAEVTKESLLGYITKGDLNWRHNISGQPFLPIFISPFFIIGLIGTGLLAIRYVFQPRKRKNDWKYFLLTGWFWGMLLPVVTTAEGIPHGLRSIGTIPVVFIMASWGLMWVMDIVSKVVDRFWNWLSPWKQKLLSIAFSAKTVAFIAAIILQCYFLYFVGAANSPENFYSFRSDLTVVSDYLKTAGAKTNTYLILDKFSVQTTDYFTAVDGANPSNPKNQPYVQVDPEDSWQLAGLKTGDQIVFTQSSIFDIKKFKQYHPEAHLTLETRNKFNQTVLVVYTIN